ncbi:peptidoglycan DD-metalloendopeptidase family protein [Pseudomonas sp. MWU12-2029]|uniref:peptidoglycan DD-metalloendopeptidase family protein n=1 Tax=Pseudomonas sp. MWU12-2029 TaxID=2927805 RepID=UPI00200FBC79|nr:peptidoglycan DD-metalloendopeptidase family protein [Pseudomonas sp. MWU12-2029]
MSFSEVMHRVLPPVNGHQPHITGVYGEQRANGPHGGTDFNYEGGQNGINLQNPKVYAPISGTVTFTGGNYGTIKIKDADGNSHEILHTSSHSVSQGMTVAAGDEIGTMGGKGPNGITQYPRHVHYQMKSPSGNLISPEVWWSQQSAATPAAAPVAAQGPAPLMNFQYPFRQADGKQFSDAEEVYKTLANERSGHYLLGSNKFWHGGIHISEISIPQCVLNEPIRCVADGKVVAYRLNEDYLESTFGDGEKKLKYSNSFCLVRHEYKSAPNPEEGVNKGKQNKLNFYSLYMHLLPYQGYPLTTQEKPTPKVTMKVGDFKAYDEAPVSAQTPSPGKVASGTKLEIIDQKDIGNVTYAKGKILSGSVKSGSHKVRGVGREIWFAYMKDGEPYKNSKGNRIWLGDAIPERARPNYWQGKVKAQATRRLPIFQPPAEPVNEKVAGPRVAGNLELAVKSVIEFDSTMVVNLVVGNVLRRMAPCTLVSGGVWQATGSAPSSFWTIVENDPSSQFVRWDLTPTNFDNVIKVGAGVKAGDPVGYLGLVENLVSEQGEISGRRQVHIEIFTDEADVNKFLENSAVLKIGRKYLWLPSKTVVKNKAPSLESKELNKDCVIDLSKASVIKEGGEEYYEVKLFDGDQEINGLVKKAGTEVITQHDWEKLGFHIVEETNSDADGFLDSENMPKFFKEIFAKIDKNHDGEVDASELADALRDPAIRDQWAKLVAHHPTEWKSKSDAVKWAKLEKLLEGFPKTLKHEKERIDKYVFWDELVSIQAMASDVVWHFHPIEFISNHLLKPALAGWAHSAFGNLLAKVESSNDYTAYNRTVGNEVQPYYNTNLTSLTIAEVQAKQENSEMFATGRYQIVTSTLADAVDKLKLDTSQKYDEAMQDKIFDQYLIRIKRKAIINYLEGSGDVEDAIYAWAKEFASAGVRRGKRINPTYLKDSAGHAILDPVTHKRQMIERVAEVEGVSYYQGDGLNVAHIKPDEMVRVLEESKKNAN